jgi:hypothetical protein
MSTTPNPNCPVHGTRVAAAKAATMRVSDTGRRTASAPAATASHQRTTRETPADIKAATLEKVRRFLSANPPADDVRTPAIRAAEVETMRRNCAPSPTNEAFNLRVGTR